MLWQDLGLRGLVSRTSGGHAVLPAQRNAAGEVLFFRPVFNIADSFITVAVFLIIIFYRKDLDASLSGSRLPKQ